MLNVIARSVATWQTLLSAFVATVDDSSSSVGGGVANSSLQCALRVFKEIKENREISLNSLNSLNSLISLLSTNYSLLTN